MVFTFRLRKEQSFNGVGAGQTAVLSLNTVGTYRDLYLFYNTGTAGGPTQANMEAEITQIRLKLNGQVQRTFSARQLFDLFETYRGRTVLDGVLRIPFSEEWLVSPGGEDAGSWGMGGISSFTCEVDIAAGATNPTLRASTVWNPNTTNIGNIVRWERFTVQPSAAGDVDFTPPRRGAIIAQHYDMTNVTLNSALVLWDQEERLIDGSKADIDEVLKAHDFVPQSDWMHVDFRGHSGRFTEFVEFVRQGANGQRPVADFRTRMNAAGAGNVTVLQELLANPAA